MLCLTSPTQKRVAFGKKGEEGLLDAAAVLIFVHKEVLKPLPVFGGDVLLGEGGQSPVLHVGEVDDVLFPLEGGIFLREFLNQGAQARRLGAGHGEKPGLHIPVAQSCRRLAALLLSRALAPSVGP